MTNILRDQNLKLVKGTNKRFNGHRMMSVPTSAIRGTLHTKKLTKVFKIHIITRVQPIRSQIQRLMRSTTINLSEVIIKAIFTTWHTTTKILSSARTKLTKCTWQNSNRTNMHKWLAHFRIMKQIQPPLQPIINWNTATIADRAQVFASLASGTKKVKRTTTLFLVMESRQILRATWRNPTSHPLRIDTISSLEHSAAT